MEEKAIVLLNPTSERQPNDWKQIDKRAIENGDLSQQSNRVSRESRISRVSQWLPCCLLAQIVPLNVL